MNNVLKRIQLKYNRMSPTHKSIANFILKNHNQLSQMTARELAEKTYSVPSNIVSFSKKLGYTGFNELKFNYINDEKTNQHVESQIITALMMAESVTKKNEFKEAVDLLMTSNKIFIIAFQMSQIPAKDFYFRMRKIEPAKMVFFESYPDQFRMASMMGDNDIALIVSNSGESDEILNIESELTKRKCKQILITNGINSSLAKFATIELSIGCLEENPVLFKEVPTTARYALIYLLERIYLEFLNVNYEENIERIKSISHYFKG